LRNHQQRPSAVGDIAIKFSIGVGKQAEANDFFGHPLQLGFGIRLGETH
jgi:hypothetical protein